MSSRYAHLVNHFCGSKFSRKKLPAGESLPSSNTLRDSLFNQTLFQIESAPANVKCSVGAFVIVNAIVSVCIPARETVRIPIFPARGILSSASTEPVINLGPT
jgi:hypothetical protein